MVKCSQCNKTQLFFKKKYYVYPGETIGSNEITAEKILCKKCLDEYYKIKDDSNIDKRTDTVKLMVNKEFTKALKALDSTFNEKDPSCWYSKANILVDLKRYDGALKCYNEALFLDTHYIKAWYRKGSLLLASHKYIDAAKCLENVIDLDKETKINKNILTGWGFPALFNCMISWILANNDLIQQKKDSPEVYEIAGTWIKRTRPYLTSPHPLFKDDNDKLSYVTLVPPELDETKFVDYCWSNYNKILDLIEPPVIAEFRISGEKH